MIFHYFKTVYKYNNNNYYYLGSPNSSNIVVSDPVSVVHKLHVDNDMTWSLEDPANSFEFVEKLGEGYNLNFIYLFIIYNIFIFTPIILLSLIICVADHLEVYIKLSTNLRDIQLQLKLCR